MKQILQSLKSGATEIADVPWPSVGKGQILIRSSRTLVSAGTERSLVDFGKAGFIDKALQQPEKVRMVLDKVRTDGVVPTLEAVINKLDQPLAMGYCNAGVIIELGTGASGFCVGDRVASNGKHAAVVSVPVNLCAKIPDHVSDDEASFSVLGAIALQGIRLVQPTLGESVVVTGLGLIGLLTVQLLRANGCRVLGIDFDPVRLALAQQFGAEIVNLSTGQDPVAAATAFSRGRGVDAVLITASTKSSEPVHQAALMCRKRGRIVLVGVTGLDLLRTDFYEKELSFQVSCSYGPGRYDPNYEEKGQDYPVGYVRWTEQRNLEAVLDMMADGRLNVAPLISHRFPIEKAAQAYELMGGAGVSLGILLEYPLDAGKPVIAMQRQTQKIISAVTHNEKSVADVGRETRQSVIAFIGSGNYATATLIPAFKATGARLKTVASINGVSGLYAGRKFGFEATTTDVDSVFDDPLVDALVIATRHDSHARLVQKGLAAGKHVFVEKPLCLTLDELASIAASQPRENGLILMVGFNRRFAPQVRQIKALLAGAAGPKAFILTVNAGAISAHHWTQDRDIGGGRIIGEVCHFVDLLRFLSGAPIVDWRNMRMHASTDDTVSIQLEFADGSIGTIHYFSNGSKSFPKERLEVFADGRVLQLDNFRKLTGFGWAGFKKLNLWRQDKGQKECAMAFVNAIRRDGQVPIPMEEILEVSRMVIQIAAV